MTHRLSRLRFSSSGSFRRGVAVLAGGALVGQLAIVAVSPVVTRLYGPAAFGALGIYLALLVILVSIASLRYELAVPLPEEERVASNLLVVCVIALTATSLITGLVVAFAGDWIARRTNTPNLAPFLWLLPVGLFAGGLYQVLSFWAIRRKELGRIARSRLTQGFGLAAIQVIVGVFRSDPLGLIIGSVVGRAAGTTGFVVLVWRDRARTLALVNVAGIRAAAVRFKRFPLVSTWSALLESGGLQSPALLLGAFYGAPIVGWFALTQRVIGIPMTFFGSAVAQAYFGEAAVLARTDPVRLEALFLRAARNLALVGLVPFVVVFLFGPSLFGHVFGSVWTEAGSYARLLSVMFFAQFVTAPLAQTLNIFERLNLQLAYDATRLVLGLGAIIAAHAAGLSAYVAVAIFSGGMTLAYIANFVLGLSEIRRAGERLASGQVPRDS